MNEEQLARFKKDINDAIDKKEDDFKNLVEIIDKYKKETGRDIELELKIEDIFINVDGERASKMSTGRCVKIPCPPYLSCLIPC
jgi:hypothetical protein